uniref:Cathepsin propeptide inhibitor domain-containing protein n=1 Tax=Angiostrongylus cantonensis TaxID=6313 RepID=A0A0K0DPE3_ANGCA
MRRSRSAGDKFVFGSRRRTLTPSSGRNDEEENNEAFIGMKSPRPNKAASPSNNPLLNKDRQYWQSHYHITDWKQQHPNEFEQKEFERFNKWIFERGNEENIMKIGAEDELFCLYSNPNVFVTWTF